MSRHRNVRSMNYSEEYDGYDDVYGHSVEDDYSMSPSDAAFMYDRNRQPQMSAFLAQEDDIAEEDETELAEQRRDLKTRPVLNDTDEARLRSCLEEIRNVIGDTVSESVVIDTIITHDFDLRKSLDAVLAEATRTRSDGEERRLRERSKEISSHAGAKRPAILGDQIQPDMEFSTLNLVSKPPVITLDNKAILGVKVVPPGAKTLHVTKGFEVSDTVDSLRADSNNATPRSQSPASGRITPLEDKIPTRSRDKHLDVLAQYATDRGERKEQLHMVVIGHVDAGKSTLMGHLLYSLGQVNKKTMHKYEQESKKLGKQSFLYAWILDETGEERSRGVTMDVGESQFETSSKSVTLLDAPGHKDFIPNMITGATQADVALLVVDATTGEFETGFESGGQTREHALLVRSLGVSQLGVAVNKMETVQWSQERFNEIVLKLKAFLKQAGFRESDVMFVPCSGLTGENLVDKPSEDMLLQWYSGPTLLDVIDKFRCPERPISKPFRLSVNDIFKGVGSGFCVSGRIETGALQPGDRVLLQPHNEPAQIKALIIDELPATVGYAGDHVSVTLSGVDITHMSVGNVLCDPSQPIPVTTRLEARIVLFNINIPITKGCTVVVHLGSLVEQAVISKLVATLHKSSGEVVKRRPRCLTKNSTALVEIQTSKPICVELYRDVRELGRFMLRAAGVTVAAGLVTKIF